MASFDSVQAGSYNITTSKTQYTTGKAQNQTVTADGATEVSDITIESTETTGTITGKITGAGVAAAGVTVKLKHNDKDDVTATTDENGVYSITADAASGYTMEISKTGYATQEKGNITIQKANTITDFDMVIVPNASEDHTYAIKENFNDYAAGALSSATWATAGTGSATVTADADDDTNTNKYLSISKTGNNSFGVYNTSNANLGVTEDNTDGIITIGARVKRTTGNGVQFSMFSFNKENWNASKPMSSSNAGATFAMANSETFSHYLDGNGKSSAIKAGEYTTTEKEWHKLWIVANLNTHTYDFYYDDNAVFANATIDGEAIPDSGYELTLTDASTTKEIVVTSEDGTTTKTYTVTVTRPS